MKLYNLDSVLSFGKYKGETVLEILKKDTKNDTFEKKQKNIFLQKI